MSDYDIYAAIFIRSFNAVLWTILLWRIARRGMPVLPLIRLLILSVLFFGMWVLVIGSLTSIGLIEGDVARMIYTIFTAYAAIIAIGILWGDRERDE